MIRLARIVLREIRLALKEPFRISSGVIQERRILLLDLTDADGTQVWAECVAGEMPNYSAETIDTAWHAITEWIAPRVLGATIDGPEVVHDILARDLRGHEMAKAAIEMGGWGLEATRRNVALSSLLGGMRASIPTGISIGIQATPEAIVQRAVAARALGYRKIKLKIQPGSDIEFVRAVRAALPTTDLMADANSAYAPSDGEHLKQLDEFQLTMIEQPLGRDDLVRHAVLQRMLRTPICLDESITSVDRAEDMISLGSGRIINIKPGRVGGFTSARAIHDLCEAHGIPVWCGGMFESGIGRSYNVALASMSNFQLPGDLSPSARYWERDVVTPEWTMDGEGMVTVPTGPGLGVTVDVDRVENLTVRRSVLQ